LLKADKTIEEFRAVFRQEPELIPKKVGKQKRVMEIRNVKS